MPAAPAVASRVPAAKPVEAAWFRDPWVWIVAVGAVALVAFSTYKFWPPSEPGEQLADDGKTPHNMGELFGPKSGAKPLAEGEMGDLLSEMTREDDVAGKEGGGVLGNSELEEQFKAFVQLNDQLGALKKRVMAVGRRAQRGGTPASPRRQR